MTVATEIYATGVHPYDGANVCVARSPEEKQEQRSFFFWYKPEMKKALRASMNRLGLGGIAKRLLDDKRKTEDVTPPPPHITPCGMKIPIQPGQRLTAATKGAKRPVDAKRGEKEKSSGAKNREKSPTQAVTSSPEAQRFRKVLKKTLARGRS